MRGEIDMCKAMEEHDEKTAVLALIKGFRVAGFNDEEIIKLVKKTYDVEEEYVKQLMKSAA